MTSEPPQGHSPGAAGPRGPGEEPYSSGHQYTSRDEIPFIIAVITFLLIVVALVGYTLLLFGMFVVGDAAFVVPSAVRDILGVLVMCVAAWRQVRFGRVLSRGERTGAELRAARSGAVRALVLGASGVALAIGLSFAIDWLMPGLYQRGLMFPILAFAACIVPTSIVILRASRKAV